MDQRQNVVRQMRLEEISNNVWKNRSIMSNLAILGTLVNSESLIS